MLDASTTSQSTAPAPTKERGQAMVEFALVLPILCMILFAIIQFGLAFWRYQQVSAAASEGARRAAVSRPYADRESRAITAAKDASPGLTASSMNVSVSSTWTAGSPVTVTVTYPQKITIMGVTFFNGNLTGKRTMRVEQ